MLNIKNLTKTYGEKKAVDDLTLHIAPGEIYGFIGHNGAGKTSTLKSVVGILQFDEGEITINGISIKDDPLACKKIIAYIPDNPDLYEYMTGIKYLEPAAVSLSALCLLTKARSGRGRIKRQIHQLEIRLCRIGFYEAFIFQIFRVGEKTALLRRREYAKPRFALFAAVADTFVEQVV